MLRRSRFLAGVAASVLAAFSVAHAADHQEGTLVVALETLGGQTMDPILEDRAPHAHYQAPIFDALIGFNLEEGGLGPGVTEKVGARGRRPELGLPPPEGPQMAQWRPAYRA